MNKNFYKLKSPLSEMTVEELTELQDKILAKFQEYCKKLSLKPTSEISYGELVDAYIKTNLTCTLVKIIEKKKIENKKQEEEQNEGA